MISDSEEDQLGLDALFEYAELGDIQMLDKGHRLGLSTNILFEDEL